MSIESKQKDALLISYENALKNSHEIYLDSTKRAGQIWIGYFSMFSILTFVILNFEIIVKTNIIFFIICN